MPKVEMPQEGDGKQPHMTPHDFSRINVDDDHDLIYWSSHFDCTRDELRTAVEHAGDSIPAVEKLLLAL